MSFHKRPEKDTVNPPGQIIHRPPSTEEIQKDQEAWDRYEKSRYTVPPKYLKDIITRIEDQETDGK